jgi:hypothetical protein
MSHEIYENDKHEGIEQAWHGLTDVKAVISLLTCWLATWDIKVMALFRKIIGTDGTESYVDSGNGELACTDNESLRIGKAFDRETYYVFTNKAFLQLVADCMAKLPGSIVASVGSLKNRALIFVSVAIPDFYTKSGKTICATFTAAGREVKCYLSFLSSHDKSTGLTVVMSSICTVCFNTFSANLAADGNKTFKVHVKHTKNMAASIADIPAMVEAFFMTVERFKAVLDALYLVPCTLADAQAFFAGLLSEAEDFSATELDKLTLSTRRFNQVERLAELFVSGKGNTGSNLSDVFNAVTDFYTHESHGGSSNPARQTAASEVGDGQAKKALAYVILQDDKRIARTMQVGRIALANRAAELAAQETKA